MLEVMKLINLPIYTWANSLELDRNSIVSVLLKKIHFPCQRKGIQKYNKILLKPHWRGSRRIVIILYGAHKDACSHLH